MVLFFSDSFFNANTHHLKGSGRGSVENAERERERGSCRVSVSGSKIEKTEKPFLHTHIACVQHSTSASVVKRKHRDSDGMRAIGTS